MKKDKLVKENEAVKEMVRIGVDPKGIKYMQDKVKYRLIRLPGIRTPLANIIKEDLLSVGGDAAVNKWTCACKFDHTDILLIGNIKHYRHLVKRLKSQPYNSAEVAKRIRKILREDFKPHILQKVQ